MKKQNWYSFVAGHSGGHIIPCLTLAQKMVAQDSSASILFFTTKGDLDTLITEHHAQQFRIIRLPTFSFNHHNPLALLKDIGSCIFAFVSALYHLLKYRPQNVTSTGGICAIPIAIAACCLRIPIDLYELNVLPGRTIYFLAPYAHTIYCCFARTIDFLSSYPCKKVEYPIRFPKFSTNPPQDAASDRHCEEQRDVAIQCKNKNHLKSTFNHLDRHASARDDEQRALVTKGPKVRNVILILGGSQGSVFINSVIKMWLTNEPDLASLHIIHQTGSRDTTNWRLWYTQHDISAKVFDYSDALHTYYAVADLVICRSGAGSLFETLYYGTPCITIPLESLTNTHQVHNAFTMETQYPDQFTVCTQSALTHNPQLLAHIIHQRLSLHTTKQSVADFAPQEQAVQ